MPLRGGRPSSASAAAACSSLAARALALLLLAAPAASDSLADLEHIVIFMQQNRAFGKTALCARARAPLVIHARTAISNHELAPSFPLPTSLTCSFPRPCRPLRWHSARRPRLQRPHGGPAAQRPQRAVSADRERNRWHAGPPARPRKASRHSRRASVPASLPLPARNHLGRLRRRAAHDLWA
jgi:hypothetical protein